MKRVLVILLCLLCSTAIASHIVGGEFELLYIRKNVYRLNLILYFDRLHSTFEPPGNEFTITVGIFSKRSNQLIQEEVLVFDEDQMKDVEYYEPTCSNGEVVTARLLYWKEITLSDLQFSDPQGYYVIWERCCRNYEITNIYSEDPNDQSIPSPIAAGQTFYLEFPAIIKNGSPFINSSPILNPPLNDFGCANLPYFVDFAGEDKDRDSLVYSLVTPLSTHTADANPPGNIPRPGPYPSVQWRPGFSLDNIVQGAPDLSISRDGLLRVTPTIDGIFVFGVRVEEFRAGEKIGELRRDFQLVVAEGCEPAEPPVITAKELSSPDFSNSLSVSFSNDVADDERCIEVKVSDPDALSADNNFSEVVKLRAIAIGFKADVSEILPEVKNGSINPSSPEKVFRICFEKCPYNPTGDFVIGIIAADDACALPLMDTVKINVHVEPPPNVDPYFETPDVAETLAVNMEKSWDISGVDADLNPLDIKVITDGFVLEEFGMSLETIKLENGKYEAKLNWDPDCNVLKFGTRRDFNIKIAMDDIECNFNQADTMEFDLHVEIPVNTAPVLTVTSASEIEVIDGVVTAETDMPIVLDVSSKDMDVISPHNALTLELDTAASELPDGYTFTNVTGTGQINSVFSWSPDCSIFTEGVYRRDYKFVFRTFDQSCIDQKSDTVEISAIVKDIDQGLENFLPPNLVTPNGDGYNEFFGLDEIAKISDSDVLPNLPRDNCMGKFLAIRIYNRWGKKVFESDQRNFRWYANNQAAGIYFYYISYTNVEFKGSINLKF
jgi:hypothetical protein